MQIALDGSYSVDAQPSGIAVYSRELMRGLANAYGQDRFVYCYRPKQYLHAPRSSRPNVSRRLLVPALSTFRADVFHALNQRVDKRPARRVVSTFHDLFVMTGEYSTREFRARFTEQARQAAERSDLIIAVSQFTANQVSNLLKVEPHRIRVVPHGVAMPSEQAGRQRGKIVLFVGALQRRKNLKRLVDAFEVLPKPWRLVLAGTPTGFKAEEVLQRIEASGCRDRIDVTGYVSRERLHDLYASASIFAFPSLDEGFGIPVLEAMAWGVPVVASNGSAIHELAQGAALLVNPEDVSHIANGLKQLADRQDLRDQLIQAGKKRAAKFTWENTVRETYKVYRELAQ